MTDANGGGWEKIRCKTDGSVCGYIDMKERPTELYEAYPDWMLEGNNGHYYRKK